MCRFVSQKQNNFPARCVLKALRLFQHTHEVSHELLSIEIRESCSDSVCSAHATKRHVAGGRTLAAIRTSTQWE